MTAFSCEEFWNLNEEDYWNEVEDSVKMHDCKISDDSNIIKPVNIINFPVPSFIAQTQPVIVEKKAKDDFLNIVVIVPDVFEVKNGFCGLQRNICVELICYSNNHKKIRAIIGMDEQNYSWTKKPFFKWKINSVIPKIVTDLSVQNANDVIVSEKTLSIQKCSNHSGWTWAFLDKVLESNHGVYSVFMRCIKPSFFNIAVGIMVVSETLPFGDCGDESMFAKYYCHGEVFQKGSSYGNHPWKENDIVGLELDTDERTLRFAVNGVRQALEYRGVPPRVLFCVCQQCRYANGYTSDGYMQARYVRYGIELFVSPAVQRRLTGRGDELEFLAFARHRSGASPMLRWAVAPAYDPDHYGYKPRVLEWIYEGKRQPR